MKWDYLNASTWANKKIIIFFRRSLWRSMVSCAYLQVQTQFLLPRIQNTFYMPLYYFLGEIDIALKCEQILLPSSCDWIVLWVLWWCLWLAGFHDHHLVNIKVLKMLPQRRCWIKVNNCPTLVYTLSHSFMLSTKPCKSKIKDHKWVEPTHPSQLHDE